MKYSNADQAISTCMACLLALFAGEAGAQSPDRINWSITPYLWGPNTKVDLEFEGASIGDELSFSDLLDTIDIAFMVNAEGGKGNWSVFGDLTYLETSEVEDRAVLSIESESKQTFIDAALSWWPGGIDSGFSVFGGLRYSGFDDRYTFRLLLDGSVLDSRRLTSDYYDALLGLRYRFDLSSRWSLLTRADTSFGDSEGTFLVRANFAWTVGQRQQNKLLFGYQYKQMEYEDGGLNTDYRMHGPMAGFSFRF